MGLQAARILKTEYALQAEWGVMGLARGGNLTPTALADHLSGTILWIFFRPTRSPINGSVYDYQ
jgi:hypothetical protein